MSRGLPSMTALLGLLAIAGYQNRDKLAEMFSNTGAGQSKPGAGDPLSGTLGNLGGMLGGGPTGLRCAPASEVPLKSLPPKTSPGPRSRTEV